MSNSPQCQPNHPKLYLVQTNQNSILACNQCLPALQVKSITNINDLKDKFRNAY
jgi:hypothetical protein